MSFKLPELKYAYQALEPMIDARTMEIHHSKHHAAYVSNLNAAISGTALEDESLENILTHVSRQSAAIRNNAGGHFNHSLFWEVLAPGGSKQPSNDFEEKLASAFGSFDGFKEQFSKAASTQFGSGWAWLVKQGNNLVISSTPNQDNPLMDVASVKGSPILGLDVWEHAYYLTYQNRRPDYIKAFFELINWDVVEAKYRQ
ncbi:MAG: superoxide dismutase [Mangrovibacterium sp.]